MQTIFFPSDTETLAGNLFAAETEKAPGILVLHGGGKGNKERFIEVQRTLLEKNISSLAIDFRGVGQSTGKFEEGTLSHRIRDAKAALQELKKYATHLGVFGSSMGGFIVPFLLEDPDVKVAVLASAAAYSEESEDKLLNEEFTQAITKPESWKTSRSFERLEKWHGKLLVMYGEFDTRIPDWIKNRYKEIAQQVHGEFMIIPGAEHSFMRPQSESGKKVKPFILETISTYVKNNI